MSRGYPRWPGAEGEVTRIDAKANEACLRFRIPFCSRDSLCYNVRIPMGKIRDYVRVLAGPMPRPLSLKRWGGHDSLEQLVACMSIDSDEEDLLSTEYKQRVRQDGRLAMREQARRACIARHAQRMEDARSVCRALRTPRPYAAGSETEVILGLNCV